MGQTDQPVLDTAQVVLRSLLKTNWQRNSKTASEEAARTPPPDAAQMLQAFRPVFEREVFLLGSARGPIRRWPLPDFFDGLETAGLQRN